MDKETRRLIADISSQIDSLEKTIELVRTSTVLCFTTMDRSPEETVSIEFNNVLAEVNYPTNGILHEAKEKMVEYLSGKINELEIQIDVLTRKIK